MIEQECRANVLRFEHGRGLVSYTIICDHAKITETVSLAENRVRFVSRTDLGIMEELALKHIQSGICRCSVPTLQWINDLRTRATSLK